MADIDAKKIAELRSLLAKATPGPWKNHLVDDTTIVASNGFEIGTTWPGGSVYNGFVDPAEQHEINAALIVAMRNALPALLDAASRAREDALREAIEICKEADAQDDRDNGAAATGAACNAANAILAHINKPKGGDANAPIYESVSGPDATSPGVTAGASAGEDGELCKRVDDTLQAMASQAFVPMGLWDKHSNGVLALIARIRSLSSRVERAEQLAYTGAISLASIDEGATRPETWKERAENRQAVFLLAKRRAEAAESEAAALREALRPFAKAASDYERQGEFFSNNIELVLRVSVFAAPEYHNSTAVQVGDLRRARSLLVPKEDTDA